MHPFLLAKPTEASKSQKNDSKFSTKTKTKSLQIIKLLEPEEGEWERIDDIIYGRPPSIGFV